MTPTRTSFGFGWSKISFNRAIAAGDNVNAALSGLNANLVFFGSGAVDDAAFGVVAGGMGAETGWSGGAVIELADVVSVLGGAGGVCSVSGRFVSRRDDDGVGEDDCGGGTIGCFDGSCVESDNARRHSILG